MLTIIESWLCKIAEQLCPSRFVANFIPVEIVGPTGSITVEAKIDTGAHRTSIDESIAKQVGLTAENVVTGYRDFYSGLGKENRPIVTATLIINGQKITSAPSISHREHMKHKVLIGRLDLQNFYVIPAKEEG